MTGRRIQPGRWGLLIFTLFWFLVCVPLSVMAAPYAALVMDARSGKVLHATNADTRLHPASLTKMMTLYVVFEAVKNGEITMDTMVRVSKKAASEPPSKLGLRAGQKIALRYLVRAAAVKSANDASTAIAEAISGSEAAFARRMNRTAKAMGMTRTTFKNAHGLTESGHLSTARDMTILGRHVVYDYPQYYNLFSRRSADAGVRRVEHTNRRLLDSYSGADGIKTGYTRAAGFNLVASAERGSERVIATVFGGRSVSTRNTKVAELLDLGFKRAPSRVAVNKPRPPSYAGNGAIVANDTAPAAASDDGRGKSVRVSGSVKKSLRPQHRPGSEAPLVAEAVSDKVEDLVAAVVATPESPPATETPQAEQVASTAPLAPTTSAKPTKRPPDLVLASTADVVTPDTEPKDEPTVITRISTSGERLWGINVGRYPNSYQAEKALLRTALLEMETLDGTLKKVVPRGSRGVDANFMGMTRDLAERACRRLQARQVQCFMIGPS